VTERNVIVNAANGEAMAELVRSFAEVCALVEEFGTAVKTPAGERLAAEVQKHKERALRLLSIERQERRR